MLPVQTSKLSTVLYLCTPVEAAAVAARTPMFALVLFVAWVVTMWQVLLQSTGR